MEFKRKGWGNSRECFDPKYQIPVSGVQTRLDDLKKWVMVLPEIPDSSKWSSNPAWERASDRGPLPPEIPDSSKWSSNGAGGRASAMGFRPEIPDSSKWSSNFDHAWALWSDSRPEIPDSSKWSSNLLLQGFSSGGKSPKYQIPASGVQTIRQGKKHKRVWTWNTRFQQVEFKLIPPGRVKIYTMSWNTRFQQVEFKQVLKGCCIVLFVFPEIPDSSKWSSNRHLTDEVIRLSKPEIPDSSKWSSNIVMSWGGYGFSGPEIPDSSKWSSNSSQSSVSCSIVFPEIPDSSKWSSNNTEADLVDRAVLAWNTRFQQVEFKQGDRGIGSSEVVAWNTRFQQVEFKLERDGTVHRGFLPEIPDSSKWSSNSKCFLHLTTTQAPWNTRFQ